MEQNGDKHRYSTGPTAIGDVDYHLGKNLLFWIDAEKREIHSQSLNVNSTDARVIFKQQGNWQPVALAVDFIADKVYVADVAGEKVDVFELDGRYHSIAIGTDLVRLLDIKVDPYEGYLFILDGFRIIRTNLDGTEPITIVRQGIRTLHGISIDVIHKRIYWSRASNFEMVSAEYSGLNFAAVGKNNSSYLIWTKFCVFNESLFWASNVIEYKSECSDVKFGTPYAKNIYQSNPVPTIKVIDSSIQKPVGNPCAKDNGGCQHMCLLASNNGSGIIHRCACNIGYKLAENSKNCTSVDNFLVYAQTAIIKSNFVDSSSGALKEPYLPISEEKMRYKDFDYRYADNYLYYLKKHPLRYDVILRVHPNESKPEIILLGNHENYQSLTVDWITANLYYTDSLQGTVNVVSTKNTSQKLSLLQKLEQPEDIIVHPGRGLLFFLQTNESTDVTMISRANTDGTNLTLFHQVPLKKRCGFAVDYEEDRIFWYQWKNKTIQHSNLDLSQIESIQTVLTRYPYAISVHDKWVYVATTNSEGLWRFDKKTGNNREMVLPDFADRIMRVKVFSSRIQETVINHPCVINNGGCSELCFGLYQNVDKVWTKVCKNSTKVETNNKLEVIEPL